MTGQRLFVAVDPPAYVIEHLSGVVGGLHVSRARARVATPDRWHITVAFLGSVPDERVSPVHRALARAAAAPGCRPLVLRIAGGGRFDGRGGAVLWAGVEGDVEGLRRVVRAVRRELRQERFTLERRAYRPHLTIARPGDRLTRELVTADVATLAGYRGPEWTAEEFSLVRSHLGPRPWYETLERFRFPG